MFFIPKLVWLSEYIRKNYRKNLKGHGPEDLSLYVKIFCKQSSSQDKITIVFIRIINIPSYRPCCPFNSSLYSFSYTSFTMVGIDSKENLAYCISPVRYTRDQDQKINCSTLWILFQSLSIFFVKTIKRGSILFMKFSLCFYCNLLFNQEINKTRKIGQAINNETFLNISFSKTM